MPDKVTHNDFTMKQKLQERLQLVREYMDVKQERHKTYYDRSRYGTSSKVVEEVLVFSATVKKGETRKLILSIEYHTQYLKL